MSVPTLPPSRPAHRSKFLFDSVIFITSVLLVSLGLFTLYIIDSVKLSDGPWSIQSHFGKQLLFLLPGICAAILMMAIDYRRFNNILVIGGIFSFGLLLLVLVLLVSPYSTKSWLGIGGFGIQPSELSKLILVICEAWYLAKIGDRINQLQYFIIALLIPLPLVGLVMLQPDPGTTLILLAIPLGQLFAAGAPGHYILTIVMTGAIAMTSAILVHPDLTDVYEVLAPLRKFALMIKDPEAINNTLIYYAVTGVAAGCFYLLYRVLKKKVLVWGFSIFLSLFIGVLSSIPLQTLMKPHHIDRFVSLVTPRFDPQDKDHDIHNNKLGISAGEITGLRHFTSLDDAEVDFRRTEYTDYIFVAFAMEFGFIGVLVLLGLYTILLARGIIISYQSRDNYGGYLGVGIVVLFATHIVVNIGMTVGLMPVIGIPLPFMSAGGSYLITCLMAIGLLLNIRFHQHVL